MESQLLAAICRNFADIGPQLAYAEYLTYSGDNALSRYVRFRASHIQIMDDPASFREMETKRKQLLDENPRFWLWDDFLSQRFVRLYRAPIIKYAVTKSPATLEGVLALEERLGVSLPYGYRAFLLEVSDGSSLHVGQAVFVPLIFSIAQIMETLDEPAVRRANETPRVSWRHIYSRDRRITELDDDDFPCIPPRGFLLIGDHGYGKYYLSLHGETRGTVWGCCPEQDEVLSMENNSKFADYPEKECDPDAQRTPQDAVRAIHSLVLERWDDAYNLPER